ncbi:hypothetical protein SBF1_5970002 [Candidatus Desulfosporosinus infrequens]|uniref:Uncharacterized protein n=1 Tax=Candidatus Desulfosporosinus infrequens TaxID=2043169 RepID=A0A2U3LLA9_9FIRM|nr:hypothetical protein SBF1_5970002 [Candidatus Desulfosporosinus infrequens]
MAESYRFDLVDLGIAKLHFERMSTGHFQLGNHDVYRNEK